MLTINFTENCNGKLYNDIFGDIRVKDPDYQVGVDYEITLRNQSLGIARIEVIRNFPALRLTDAVSLLNSGTDAAKQRALLSRHKFGNITMPDDVILSHLIFCYTERNLVNQSILIKEWWASKSNSLWNQS